MRRFFGFTVLALALLVANCGGSGSSKDAGSAISGVMATGTAVSSGANSRALRDAVQRAVEEVRDGAQRGLGAVAPHGRADFCSTVDADGKDYTDSERKLQMKFTCADNVVTAVVTYTADVTYACVDPSNTSTDYTVKSGSKSTVTFADFTLSRSTSIPSFKYTLDLTVTGGTLGDTGAKFEGGFTLDFSRIETIAEELSAAGSDVSKLAEALCTILTEWTVTVAGGSTDCKSAMEHYAVCTQK